MKKIIVSSVIFSDDPQYSNDECVHFCGTATPTALVRAAKMAEKMHINTFVSSIGDDTGVRVYIVDSSLPAFFQPIEYWKLLPRLQAACLLSKSPLPFCDKA